MATGQINGHDTRIAPHQLGHDRPGPIARTVVQHNELVVGADRALGGSRHAPVEFFKSLLLIVARSNNGEPRAGARI